jgi:DNA-binding transcriptional LysR family regulator
MFLERCHRILNEIEAAEHELLQSASAPRGRLRISLPLLGEPFLRAFSEFNAAYPDVALDLDFNDQTVDAVQDGFDAVIRTGSARDSRLTSRSLGRFRMLLVGSPGYLARKGMPTDVSQLSGHSCIQFRLPNTGRLQTWPMPSHELALLTRKTPSIVCNNTEARVAFALHGVGLSYVPDFTVADELERGTLINVLSEDVTNEEQFTIMWPSGRRPAPKLRALIDFLSERLFR